MDVELQSSICHRQLSKNSLPLGAANRSDAVLEGSDKVAGNFRLMPRIRHMAENQLKEKVQDLTFGEKISLARTAPQAVIGFLRWQSEPEVIRALLRNSHLCRR